MSLTLKLVLSAAAGGAGAWRTRARMPRLPEAGGARQRRDRPRAAAAAADRRRFVGRRRRRGARSDAGAGRPAGRAAGRTRRACACAGSCSARSGLTTQQTLQLLRAEPPAQADVAVVVTGVNDVIDQVPSHRAVAARAALANWLRNAQGVQHVVFAPLPPIHRFPGLPQPLRWVAGRRRAAPRRGAGALGGDARRRVLRATCDCRSTAAQHGQRRLPPRRAGLPLLRRAPSPQHIATSVWPHLPTGDPPHDPQRCKARPSSSPAPAAASAWRSPSAPPPTAPTSCIAGQDHRAQPQAARHVYSAPPRRSRPPAARRCRCPADIRDEAAVAAAVQPRWRASAASTSWSTTPARSASRRRRPRR